MAAEASKASGKRIALATAGAFLAALAVFFTTVLPAEFGIDPTGVGGALGLVGLAGEEPSQVSRTESRLVADRRRFELAPFESVEFKYDLAEGDGLVYGWAASGEVVFDLHAEPAGAPAGFAESFAIGRGSADRGTYVAAYDGIHGWFWENRGSGTVAVALRVAGFAGGATRYHDGVAQRVSAPLAALADGDGDTRTAKEGLE